MGDGIPPPNSDGGEGPIIYRQRAKELRDLALTISPSLRGDLITVALKWERLAEMAEQQPDSAEDQPKG